MTTMELHAMRGELARQILNIESWDVLNKVQRYLKRTVGTEAPSRSYTLPEGTMNVVAEDEAPYRTKTEILAGMEEAFKYAKLAREGKVKGRPVEDLLNEL